MTKLWGIFIAVLTVLLAVANADAMGMGHGTFGGGGGRSTFQSQRTMQRPMMSSHRESFSRSSRESSGRQSSRRGTSSSRRSSTNKDASSRERNSHERREESTTSKDTATKGGTQDKEGMQRGGAPTSSDVARQTQQPLKFDGKPTDVPHNPNNVAGDTGTRSNGKPVLVERDGNYYKRDYYSASSGDTKTRYWYETPLDKNNPVIPLSPYIAHCPEGSDACRIVEKQSSDPEGLRTGQYTTIAGFWEWWNNIDGTCGLRARPLPGSIPAKVIISCTKSGQITPCNGVCKLYNITDDEFSYPLTDFSATAYKCECKSP